MKATTIILFAMGLVSVAGLVSCKKEKTIKSSMELLTQKAWKFEIYGLDENNNGVIEASESDMLPCQTDDAFTFYSNGTGVYSSGALKCNADDSTTNFNWQFMNNQTQLAVFAYPEMVNKLDENTLETYYEDINSQGQTVKYIKTFKH
jgi:hypothetical protein